MAGEINRDRTIEHLLRQAQPVPFSAPTPGCLDPERLAAWQAGSLRTSDAAAVETHLADCGYCQTMLAGFVESEPAPAAAVPFWQRWNARWLVPATVAAAAVLVWVIIPHEGAPPTETPASPTSPTSTMARVERFEAPEPPAERAPANEPAGNSTAPAAPPAATADARLRQETPLTPSAAEQRASVEQRDVTGKTTSSRAGAAVGAAAPQQVADDARVAAPFAAPRPSAAAVAPPPAQASVAAPAASPPPPAAPPASVRAEPAFQEVAGAPLQAPSGGAGRGTGVGSRNPGASNVMMDGVSSVGAAIAIHARVDRTGPVAFGPPAQGTVAARRGAALTREFASVLRWRLSPDGRLDRSFDEGQTWSAVTIEGASFFTAGSSPLDGVCWLVDRDGGVWRSTGGGAFARASFAASAPPVAIEALDATRASVTTSDGRQFTTIDGGTTWR